MYIKNGVPHISRVRNRSYFFLLLTKKRAFLEYHIHFKVYLDSLHVFTGNFVSCEIRH